MRRDSWRAVKDIFQAALERDAKERQAFLMEACRGDDALRAEVESLLKASESDAAPWLDRPVFEAAAATLIGEIPEGARENTFGPYKIVGDLGQGGMGKVYLGRRADDQYQSRVAIKLVRQDLDSEDILRRFRQERQILASLEHPYIAKLLDGGVNQKGLPYFIMEYIEGKPIDKFCDENHLSLTERIQLFHKVCSAVHYAHRNLVVHCDLKPSNILITEEGLPKLLDFGIARLLGSEHVPQVTLNMSDSRQLTPEYASPEQVRGERLTTASDVYSLGVLLYRLLTGRLPFRFYKRVLWEVERIICEEEPTRPSEAVIRPRGDENIGAPPSPGTATAPRSRLGSPEKLRRLLTGDLDNIILMTLRKDPARRYGSAEQLSEDLRRYEKGQVVLARKDTLAYRVNKFVRRNRVSVSAAVLVGMALILGIFLAEGGRRSAEQKMYFLLELLEAANPKDEVDRDARMELLDQFERKINEELAAEPEMQLRMMNAIAETYQGLGFFEKAAHALERALEIRQHLDKTDDLASVKTLERICSLYRETSNFESAYPSCSEAVQLRRKRLDRGSRAELIESLNQIALLHREMGQFEESERHYREALDLGLSMEPNVGIAIAQHNLGGLLRIKGQYEEAESHLRRALESYRNLLNDGHPHIASGLNTLAALLQEKGSYEEAEAYYRQALKIRRKISPNHPETATTLHNLATLLYKTARYEEAEKHLRKAIALTQEHRGERSRQIVIMLNLLATLQKVLGDAEEAESLYRESLAVGQERLGQDHPSVSGTLIGLGKLLTEGGELEEAEKALREALRIREKTFAVGHWRIANVQSHLGFCLVGLHRFEEAEALLLEAYPVLEARFGTANPYTRDALLWLSELYQAWSRPEDALRYRAKLDES